MNKKLTPLEYLTNKEIKSPDNIIMDWEATSKLIYCYKNGIDLIKWMSLLSDNFINKLIEADFQFDELDDLTGQDILQVGLYLEMMRLNNWRASITHAKTLKNIKMLLMALSMESVNRDCGIVVVSFELKEGANLYDISSYVMQANKDIKFINKALKK